MNNIQRIFTNTLFSSHSLVSEEYLKEMIKEETKKAKKKGLKGGIETDFYEDKGEVPLRKRIKKVKKGGLIRSKPRDGIAKKGKTKGRIIRGVLNK